MANRLIQLPRRTFIEWRGGTDRLAPGGRRAFTNSAGQ
ncbi:hypothetical protein CF161_21776 [Pseudomonas sp. CF161]|nr:hypothetical protein CF161_21776 [Pseudomonas sp. CF161]